MTRPCAPLALIEGACRVLLLLELLVCHLWVPPSGLVSGSARACCTNHAAQGRASRVAKSDNALTYWFGLDPLREQTSREGALNGSRWRRAHSGRRTIGAKRWCARLDCMADEGKSAFDRWNSLRGQQGRDWYAARLSLLPPATERRRPKVIAKHVKNRRTCTKPPPRLPRPTLRLHVVSKAADAWWNRYSAGIQAAAQMAVEEEKAAAEAKKLLFDAPAQPAAPANHQAKRPKPSPVATYRRDTGHGERHAATILVMPKCLVRLLDNPTTMVPSTSRPGIRQAVEAAFVNQRIARVWVDADGTRRLTFLRHAVR